MDRKDFYYKQLVSPAEMDGAFDAVEASIQGAVQGSGLYGLALNGDVSQRAPTPVMGVTVVGPVLAYDENGNRILVPGAATNVDCTIDENSASTSVSGSGQERWLSLFLKFDRVISDPRLDGNGDTVFFSRAEGYKLVVVAGAPAAAGTASRPVFRAGHVLLADIKIVYGQTAVLAADIVDNRTQFLYAINGSPVSLRARSPQQAMQAMLEAVNTVIGAAVPGTLIPITPAGGISSSNAQAALYELDAEKSPKAAPVFTGNVTTDANVVAADFTFSPAKVLTRILPLQAMEMAPYNRLPSVGWTRIISGTQMSGFRAAGAGVRGVLAIDPYLPIGGFIIRVDVTLYRQIAYVGSGDGYITIYLQHYTYQGAEVGASHDISEGYTDDNLNYFEDDGVQGIKEHTFIPPNPLLITSGMCLVAKTSLNTSDTTGGDAIFGVKFTCSVDHPY